MASIRERATTAGERSWQVLYRHGKKQPSKTFATRKAAERFKALVEALGPDRALAALAEEADDRMTVEELAEKFLNWKARSVTERTIHDYRRDVGNYIIPWMGHRVAETIDEGDVQKWVDHMADSLLPKTVADRHMLLHSMYDFGRAKSRRLVTHNPCLETDLPKRAKRGKPKGTTTPEFRALLAAASERNPDAHDLILFLGETGWRFSEATALDVRDVTDDGRNVWVDMARVFRLDRSGRQFIAEGEAKSEAGLRYIRMFPASAAMIRRRLIGKAPGQFVFTNSRGNHWNQNTFLRNTWPGILAASGIATEKRKPTPHWLRHMHVAVLAAAKVPMHEIQRRIGHEHYSTTVDVYGGMIGDIDDSSMDHAAALMSGEATAPNVAPADVVLGEVILGELG